MRLPWEPEAQQLAGEGKGRVVSPRVGGCGEGTGLTHQEECSGVLVEPWGWVLPPTGLSGAP